MLYPAKTEATNARRIGGQASEQQLELKQIFAWVRLGGLSKNLRGRDRWKHKSALRGRG